MMKDSNENTYSVYSYLSRRSTEQLDEMLSLYLQQEIDDFDEDAVVLTIDNGIGEGASEITLAEEFTVYVNNMKTQYTGNGFGLPIEESRTPPLFACL